MHEPRRHRREPNVSLRRLYGRGIADHAIGTHESPEDAGDEDGGITAFHTSELAFCFHALSVPQIHIPTGGGPVAMALQDKVSQAWINFARTGDPNQPSLAWKPYTKETQEAMVFDTVSRSVPLQDDKLIAMLPVVGRGGGPAPAPAGGAGRGGRG